MNHPIYIKSFASISSLGAEPGAIRENYRENRSNIQLNTIGDKERLGAPLDSQSEKLLNDFLNKHESYKNLDRSTQLALFAASRLHIDSVNKQCGVNISSSRGATGLTEKYLNDFLQGEKLSPQASPSTTAGNLSSWISQYLQLEGIAMSHSITCSSALHSFANAIAWLQAGMSEQFIVGGAEAPLTPFTLEQMKALKIYSKDSQSDYPCKPLAKNPTRNNMVLGEGASLFLLDKKPEGAFARIEAIGYATERINHAVSLSPDADCLYRSMEMALKQVSNPNIDMIIMHAPGTILGDQAELNAIKKLFGENIPYLYSNKHLCGHTFGASGALSIEAAIMQLNKEVDLEFPYPTTIQQDKPKEMKQILINAVGFGANAVSIIIHAI